jgi:hypothetical protein
VGGKAVSVGRFGEDIEVGDNDTIGANTYSNLYASLTVSSAASNSHLLCLCQTSLALASTSVMSDPSTHINMQPKIQWPCAK